MLYRLQHELCEEISYTLPACSSVYSSAEMKYPLNQNSFSARNIVYYAKLII
jgi:hypothetical protein